MAELRDISFLLVLDAGISKVRFQQGLCLLTPHSLACSDVPSFIADIGNLCSLLFFL